jgi:hypothetical protein
MKKLHSFLSLLAFIMSLFACQKTDIHPTLAPQAASKHNSNAALVDYLIDRIANSAARGNTSIILDGQGNQIINPEREALTALLGKNHNSHDIHVAETFAFIEAAGTGGFISKNIITVYQSSTDVVRGKLESKPIRAGMETSSNILRYTADGWCNDYWGDFSHSGLESIEIDIFLRSGYTTVWSQRHTSITSPVFSGYLFTSFCDDGHG